MPNCQLIVDSCCDLPPEAIDHEGITLLKFPYTLNGGTFEDDLFQSVTCSDFYNSMRKGAEPTTAQLTIPLLQNTFKKAAEVGTPCVYLSFSSGLSGSYDVALLVRDQIKEEYPDFELYVVDSRLASIPEGLFVFEAIKQWEKGLTASELVEWAEEARFFVQCEFMVEDLQTLKRGGRIPGSVAVAGAALDVKPMLSIDADGKLQLVGVARGRKQGIKKLLSSFEKNATETGRGSMVIIGNADCPKDAHRLKELVEKAYPDTLVMEANIGPVIGSHVGPGMLAITYWASDKREKLSVADRIAKRVKGDK